MKFEVEVNNKSEKEEKTSSRIRRIHIRMQTNTVTYHPPNITTQCRVNFKKKQDRSLEVAPMSSPAVRSSMQRKSESQ